MKKRTNIFILTISIFSLFCLLSFEKIQTTTTVATTIPTPINQVPSITTQKEETNSSLTKKEATLEIPKISLKKDYYSINDSKNTVNIGIEQLSDCKPTENCTIVLAAHSGTSNISHFKNLNQLKQNDLAFITYQNTTYTYQLINIFHEEKTGFITIPKNSYDLVLTTCNKEKQNIQDIYLFIKK